MKYFRYSDYKNDINQIVSEMINITFRKLHSANGKIIKYDNAVPYNRYLIDDKEYEAASSYGIIYVNDISDIKTFQKDIIDKFTELVYCLKFENIYAPRIEYIKNSVLVERVYESPCDIDISIALDFNIYANIPVNRKKFSWVITSIDNILISDINSIILENITSLFSIIYDKKNMYLLPDGYRHYNYPRIDDYFDKDKIVNDNVYFSARSGLTLEIARYFTNITNINITRFRDVSKFNPIEWKSICVFKQLNTSLTTKEIEKSFNNLGYIDIPTYPINEIKDLKCSISGVPIYEDFYVIKLFSRIITKKIKKDELKDYKTKSNFRILDNSIEVKHNSEIMVNIRYKHEFNECIVLSPYYIHYGNGIDFYENLFDLGFDYVMYRAFSPVRLYDIIKNLNISSIKKTCLHELNSSVELLHNNIFLTKNFIIINDFKVSYFNKFKGKYFIKLAANMVL
jgi:hypothetical protein